jgi:hypothetical protein
MKLPKIKLTRSTRLKWNSEPASMSDAGTKPAARTSQTTPSTVPKPVGPLPTSRWNLDQPMPVLTKLRNQPSKNPAKEMPRFQTVRFELFAPEARAVFLAGSFNQWSRSATPMTRLGECNWVKELSLSPGYYEYQFVVDGRWTPDLKAADEMPNPFGGFNSVVEVSTSP